MTRPEISIVIPTRNRPALAQVAIESALDADLDVEVIVADNSDTPLAVPRDPRVSVLPPLGRVISMTENWERALAAIRGEWVTFLSDKHRIVPGVYRRLLDDIKAAQLRVGTFERASFFQSLPGDALTVEALWRREGQLLAPSVPRRREVRSARETMEEWHRVIRGVKDRPQVYRGVIHRSVIEAAQRASSRFFFGTCPDYASGLQIMAEVERYLATSYPAVVLHIPTDNIAAWSPSQSMDEGGTLGNERIREFGLDAFAKYHLPPTVTSAILETLLEFRRFRPGKSEGVAIDWKRYAWMATHEIQNNRMLPLAERVRWQALVARATQHDGLNLGATRTQLEVLLTRLAPALNRRYQAAKLALRRQPEPICRDPREAQRPVASLVQARVELAQAFAGA